MLKVFIFPKNPGVSYSSCLGEAQVSDQFHFYWGVRQEPFEFHFLFIMSTKNAPLASYNQLFND